ncbi:hypothetical protein K435DRAFT_777121 [Dendrothele bispora CBS 962.96]|uniref:Uncharacterized protein n=1 Tax=Dendrothele bispora (strain CBS 962.96) TaxID=1314807 RepID=A0A4S8MAC2_DENBC|nr:hypothetical protein K435DRAFT_777121 [Dendrothele bispora CBS 962.96]
MPSSQRPPRTAFLTRRTVLSFLTLSVCASAIPTSYVARDDVASEGNATTKTAQDAMADFLNKYFALKHVNPQSFFALNGWTTVDFAGSNTAASGGNAANIIFHTLDSMQDLSGKGQNNVAFSTMYTDWIQDLSKALNLDDEDKAKQVVAAQNAEVKACGKQTNVLKELAQEWREGGGEPIQGISDEKFLLWAKQDSRYTTVSFDCQDKSNKYTAKLSEVYGDNFAVFSGALNNIKPIIQPTDNAYPGITMKVSATSGMPETGAGSNGAGQTVPYYSIPVLNMTLGAWQGGDQLQPFESSTDQQNSSDSEESDSSGGGLSLSWGSKLFGDVGGEGSSEHSTKTTNASASSFDFKFGSIALMDIDMGLWNDRGASAGAVLHASDGDDAKSQGAQDAFDHHIGSKDKPGPAAVWNDKALIVFQPEIEMKFSDESTFEDYSKTAVSAEGCFLFICIGGNSEQTKKMTSSSKSDKTVTFKDTSKNAYIVGYVQTSFWASDTFSSGQLGGTVGGNNGGGDGGDNGGDNGGGDNGGFGGDSGGF